MHDALKSALPAVRPVTPGSPLVKRGITMGRLPAACVVMALFGMLWVVSCTGHLMPAVPAAEPIVNDQLVILTVAQGDTLPALAETHLGDAAKAWWIAAYNGITTLAPGQRLVIPRRPIVMGGLRVDGYQTVPILLYERVGVTETPAVSRDAFEAQMIHLVNKGFSALSLDALMAFLTLSDHLPPKSLLITLEGAESWVYDTAYPVLKRHGLRALLFIDPAAVGRAGALSWEQLRVLSEDGFDIGLLGASGRGSVSPQPPENRSMKFQRMVREIGSAREVLQNQLARPCEAFAYPQGMADDLIAAYIKKQGFRAAFTRAEDLNPFFVDPFALKCRVIGADLDLGGFERTLTTFHSAELR
jgi:peptidoglycan/xylan/chitin deacetylase (PgdA/CDA1 family)